MDKASDFPARNVHSPREPANHREGERREEGRRGFKKKKIKKRKAVLEESRVFGGSLGREEGKHKIYFRRRKILF